MQIASVNNNQLVAPLHPYIHFSELLGSLFTKNSREDYNLFNRKAKFAVTYRNIENTHTPDRNVNNPNLLIQRSSN